jgi:hypothetical protein
MCSTMGYAYLKLEVLRMLYSTNTFCCCDDAVNPVFYLREPLQLFQYLFIDHAMYLLRNFSGPAAVDPGTVPQTVRHLHATIKSGRRPRRGVENVLAARTRASLG